MLHKIPPQVLFESYNVSREVYHASPVQNLKEIKPLNHTINKLSGRGIYATTDKQYASAFSFKWDDSDVTLGQPNKGGPWIIEIPKSYEDKLKKQKCSMYTLDIKYFNDMTTQLRTPEWTSSFNAVPVVKEEKFNSVLECFKRYGLKVVWK